jgi:hypothetical protein
MVSGPGSTTFSDPTEYKTQAKFSKEGVYVIRLTGSDGELSATDDLTVTVKSSSAQNQPPKVNAGQDRTIMLTTLFPAKILLTGKASDDGLPMPPGKLSVAWSQVDGPFVELSDPGSLQTYVSFTKVGVYTFRFNASDGELQKSDDIVITVKQYNMPPVVDAGPDQTVSMAVPTQMKGVVTDDGLPPPPDLIYIWSQITGPAKASFSDTSVLDPTVKFRQRGVYVFRLRSNDGAKWGADDMVINVLK